MSFELLEYPIKKWITDLIDDEQIKSEIFDLLGDPDIDLRYPSVILYNIEDLIEHDEHHLVAKIVEIPKSDTEYRFDLKNFAKCRTIASDLINVLREADAVLKFIIKHTDDKFVSLFDLNNLKVKLVNDMKLQLTYEGKDESIIKKITDLPYYGFETRIVYDNDHTSANASDNYDSEDDLKKALDNLLIERYTHV